jgi:hypothetical protein
MRRSPRTVLTPRTAAEVEVGCPRGDRGAWVTSPKKWHDDRPPSYSWEYGCSASGRAPGDIRFSTYAPAGIHGATSPTPTWAHRQGVPRHQVRGGSKPPALTGESCMRNRTTVRVGMLAVLGWPPRTPRPNSLKSTYYLLMGLTSWDVSGGGSSPLRPTIPSSLCGTHIPTWRTTGYVV